MKTRNIVALATLGFASIAGPIGYMGCRNSKTDEAIVRELTGDVFIDSQINKLNDKNFDVRRDAAKQLAETKNPITEKTLLSTLNDKDWTARYYSAWGLGKIKSKEAVQPLILLLNDSQHKVVSASVIALGEIGDKAATKPLCNILLSSKDYEDYSYVINALGKIKDKEAMSTLEHYLFKTMLTSNINATGKALDSISHEDTIKILLDHLKSNDNDKVWRSVDTLANLKAKETTPSLIPLLEHNSVDVRRSVIRAFNQIEDESVVKPLCNRFQKEAGYIQSDIIFALNSIKSKESVPSLIEFINHEEEFIRGNIAMTLGNIGDKRATKILCNRLKYDSSPQVRLKAAEALGKIADQASLETLFEVRKILIEYQGSRDLREEVDKAICKAVLGPCIH